MDFTFVLNLYCYICIVILFLRIVKKKIIFDAFNLTRKEYLMYLFKYNILQNEISY